jgi:hypothetical protein
LDGTMNEWRIARRIVIEGTNHSGWLPPGASQPQRTPARSVTVWISHQPDGYYLFTADGDHMFDSWHQTLDDAIAQAHLHYGVAAEEWEPVAAPSNSALHPT